MGWGLLSPAIDPHELQTPLVGRGVCGLLFALHDGPHTCRGLAWGGWGGAAHKNLPKPGPVPKPPAPSPAATLTHLRPPPPLTPARPRAWWALCQQARGRPLRPGSSQAVLGGSPPPLGVTRRPLPEPAGDLQGQEEGCSLWVTPTVTAASSGLHAPGQALGELRLGCFRESSPPVRFLLLQIKETEAQKVA